MIFAPSIKEKFWNERLFLKDLQHQDEKLKRIQYLGRKKLIHVNLIEGTSCGSFLISYNATRKIVNEEQKPFSFSSRLLSIFLARFMSFSRCQKRHQKCFMSYFENACVTIFSKMLCESVFSPHGFHQ